MILFLLFSIPLTYLLVNTLFNNQNIRRRAILFPFIYGLALSLPVLLLYWAFFHSFFNNWTSAGLYFYYFFNKDGLFGFYGSAVIVSYFFLTKKAVKVSRLREITAYLAGIYFSISIYDTLVAENWYGGLELLILPISRITSILLISIFLSRFAKSYDWQKYIWMGLALVTPFLMVFIPIMYVLNLQWISSAISVLIFGFSIIVYFLESKGKLKSF